MLIRQATKADIGGIAALALLLWPDHAIEELRADMEAVLGSKTTDFYVGEEAGEIVAFAQCQLRFDYVEGTDSKPVGYLEGIYVKEGFRRFGVAKALVARCEEWARKRGCREFASDCEIDNQNSLAFHLGAGFAEAGRIICFVKEL